MLSTGQIVYIVLEIVNSQRTPAGIIGVYDSAMLATKAIESSGDMSRYVISVYKVETSVKL